MNEQETFPKRKIGEYTPIYMLSVEIRTSIVTAMCLDPINR